MIARASYLAIGLALAVPGAAVAQDCEAAEAVLAKLFDRLHEENGRFSGGQFVALSEGEKWFWTSNLLAAQIRRLDAMLDGRADVPADKLETAKEVFLALDAAEPCYQGPETLRASFRDIPDETSRDRLLSEIEEPQ